MYGGARLQVRNALGDHVDYSNFRDAVLPITTFVSNYEWSHDLVIGRNATCYLDLNSGLVEKLTEQNSAHSVVATVVTDGPPELLVTPFSGAAAQVIGLDVEASGAAYLLVGNNGMDCQKQETEQNFDFLLHYLTAKTGLPSQLIAPTPGMLLPLTAFTPQQLREALPKLERLQFPERYEGHCFGELTVGAFASTSEQPGSNFPFYDTSPACSDTRYP